MKVFKLLHAVILSLLLIMNGSCRKGGDSAAPNPCSGVTVSVTATIINPGSPTLNNGSIIASATGGTGFTFSLNGGPFQTSGTFTNLAAGTYTVTAKNSNGCTGTATFTLTASNPCAGVTITVTGSSSNPTTPGNNNGSISATASGGTAPYMFSLNGGTFQTSGNFSNLTAGSYTVTARDANNCTGSATFILTDPNPCAGVTITISTTIVGNTPCASGPTGSITANATGGTGPYMYSLNGGTFQSSGVFNNLAAGNYTITARDVNSCTGSTSVNVANLPPGPLFSQVKSLIQTHCMSCHNNSNSSGGMNFENDCNIVNNRNRIKARAVDGNPSPMPPGGLLPASERQKITNWINAGGRYTD